MKNKIITIVLGSIVVLALGAVLSLHFMGYSLFVITGKSMTGVISKGSLAFDKAVQVEDLQVGDIITFRPPGVNNNVTHRIVAINFDKTGQRVFRTKGDFNEDIDPWLFMLDKPTCARYVFHIPYLGWILAIATLKIVRTALLGVAGLAIMLITFTWLRKSKQEDEEGGEETCSENAVACMALPTVPRITWGAPRR